MPQRRVPTRDQVLSARRLRKRMSAAERVFWQEARGEKLGFSIRRQHPVLQYVLDFYCPEAKLAIEFDGEQHDAERDAERDERLAAIGIATIRVPNREYFRMDKGERWRDWVVAIVRVCEARTGRRAFPDIPTPSPLPACGEGAVTLPERGV